MVKSNIRWHTQIFKDFNQVKVNHKMFSFIYNLSSDWASPMCITHVYRFLLYGAILAYGVGHVLHAADSLRHICQIIHLTGSSCWPYNLNQRVHIAGQIDAAREYQEHKHQQENSICVYMNNVIILKKRYHDLTY